MRRTDPSIFLPVLLLLVQEIVLGIQFAQVQGPFYPGGYDQVDYQLVLARMVAPDSPEGLLDVGTAQGWLLHVLAWPVQALGLPPAWAVHLPLVLVEVGLFQVARRQGKVVGWFALGLFCAARAHTTLIGGPADYRHDYLSLILFGAAALSAYAAAPFRRILPSLVMGLVAGIAVHARFVTAAYLVAALPWLLASALTSPEGGNPGRRRGVANLAASVVLAALVALPFYLVNRQAIHDYYLQGHVVSDQEAVARGFGGATTLDFLSYYLRNLLRSQLGTVCAVLGSLALAAGCWIRARAGGGLPWPRLLAVAGFLMPLVVLSLGLQRSHVVALVMVVPMVLLVVALADPLAGHPGGRRAMAVLAAVGLLAFPLQVLVNAQGIHGERVAARHDLAAEGLHRLGRAIPGDREVRVSVLCLHEALSASMLRLMRFLDSGLWGREIIGELGHTIYELPAEELRERLARSDLVLVPEGIPLPEHPLPSQVQLQEQRQALLELAAARWRRRPELGFPLEEGRVQVWVREGFELSHR